MNVRIVNRVTSNTLELGSEEREVRRDKGTTTEVDMEYRHKGDRW